MESLIHALPKAELHLHIEGTLEPDLMLKLAKRNQVTLPYKNIEEIQRAYHFQNLQSFLDLYYAGTNVLIHEEDFYELTMQYMKRAHDENVKHIEPFFDPQAHTERGIKVETVIKGIHRGLVDGQHQFGITSRLILSFLRHLTEQDAFITLEQAEPYLEWITAVGLDSTEKGNPPFKFKNVFAKAREYGLLTVVHAGEEGPAEYIWEALELLKVSRIDHGVRCLEDPKLVEVLKETQIPLTVCPISNIKLCVFDKMADHPLKKMLDAGLCACVNSDDPAYFGGYIEKNYLDTQKALNLTQEEIIQLAKNAFSASFISDAEKAKYIDEINALTES